MNPDDWLEIGKIIAPQGLQGNVKVYPSSNLSELLAQPGSYWLKSNSDGKLRQIEVLSGRLLPGKNIYVLEIAGIQNRSQAEDLRGCELLIREEELVLESEDDFLISDLINLEVYNQLTQESIGVITSVFYAGNDLLEVKLHKQPSLGLSKSAKGKSKGKNKQKIATILIPFVKEIVPVVDLETGRIEITPPQGLIELNQS